MLGNVLGGVGPYPFFWVSWVLYQLLPCVFVDIAQALNGIKVVLFHVTDDALFVFAVLSG